MDRNKILKANASALASVTASAVTEKPLSGGKVSEFRDRITRDKTLVRDWINQSENGTFSVTGEFHEKNFYLEMQNLNKVEIKKNVDKIFAFLEESLDLNIYPVEKQGGVSWETEDYKIEFSFSSIEFTYFPIWELCGYYYKSSKVISIRRS